MLLTDITESPLQGITLVYGGAGTGKTTLCLEALKGRSVYISTGSNFSPERLLTAREDAPKIIEKLVVYQPKDIDALEKAVEHAVKLSTVSDLVVVDSLASLLRSSDRKLANLALYRMLQALGKASCPVLLTSEVYDRVSGEPDSPFIGGDMLRLAAGTIVELKDGVATVKKHASHAGRVWQYEIRKEGLRKI